MRHTVRRHRALKSARMGWALSPLLLLAGPHAQAQDEASQAPRTLKPVEVRTGVGSEAQTPGRSVLSSNRLGLSAMETARSVSSVERDTLDAQAAQTEREVLRNVSGVSSRSEYYGSYSQFSIRGLWANNTYNYLRDGAKFMHLIDPPLFNVERVEVIKGPSALEFGQVAPGGLVNYVSKKPQEEALRSVRLGAGSFNLKTAELDFTGPLDSDKKLLYRLTAGVSRGGSFTDRIDPKKDGLAGAITWKISPQTVWSTQLEYHEFSSASYIGLAVPNAKDPTSANAIRIGNNYGEAGLNTTGRMGFASTELTHEFSADWQGRAYLSRNQTARSVLLPYGLSVSGNRVARGYYLAPDQRFDSDTALLELKGRLRTGAVQHRLALGLDWRSIQSRYGRNGTGSLQPVDLYDPQPSNQALPVAAGTTALLSDARNLGAFVQDQLQWQDWGLLLGLRYDRFKDSLLTPVQDFSKAQPTVALSYRLSPDLMVYASQTQSFQANSGTVLVGNVAAPPSQGKQFELGAKKEWLDGRLFTTLAYFDLSLTNSPTTDPGNPRYSVLTGKQRIRGIELEGTGHIRPNWELTAQATFMNPEVVSDNTAGVNVGNRVALATRVTSSLWTRYRLPQIKGLWVAGGLTHQGDKFLANDNRWRLPGYTTLDAALGYQLANGLRLQANLKNLSNRRYYIDGSSNAAGFTSVVPGAPRSLYVSADYAF